jgi:methylmalonyl-CoA/ethylmalonyl-CoA epimerase
MVPGEVKFHHLGLALRNDTEALVYLSHLGYTAGEKLYDPQQNVYVRLCTAPLLPAIEIVTPGEGKTPLDPILQRQPEAIYHTCYEVSDVAAYLENLEVGKIRAFCLSPPKPAILFGGRMVSFYRVIGFGIIELLQADRV